MESDFDQLLKETAYILTILVSVAVGILIAYIIF